MGFRTRLTLGEQLLRVRKQSHLLDHSPAGQRSFTQSGFAAVFDKSRTLTVNPYPVYAFLSHRFELDSTRLTPPTASDHITQRPFSTLIQGRWNQHVDVLFKSVAEWDNTLRPGSGRFFTAGILHQRKTPPESNRHLSLCNLPAVVLIPSASYRGV